MSPTSLPAEPEADVPQDEQESPPPACVLSFNASDASGAGGLAGDVATIAAMGAHCLPVVTAVVLRDTAEVFEHESLDPDTVAEQARHILEDVPITAWKVGFLGNAEAVSAVAEVLSDYPDVPLVTYLPSVAWIDEDEQQQYLDALRELVLPQTAVLVGNHKTMTDFLLPDWDNERAPSARELAVAAAQAGAQHVLNAEYFQRIDALNFTMLHDDGQHAEGLEEADVVLVGVSRTSKTPTSIYLANRGVKTGNVPLVPGVPLAPAVEKLSRPLVVGLYASPERIVQIREIRLLGLKAHRDDDQYIDKAAVAEEVSFSRRLCAKHNWPTIDVTRRSIEETAAAVMRLLTERRRHPVG